jgi:hypothetical protein
MTMERGKCRSCKHDLSDDYSIIRTNDCPDYLDGKITDGCDQYQPDEDTTLSLKEQERKDKIEAKEREKYRKKQEKARSKAIERRRKDHRKGSSSGAWKMTILAIFGAVILLLAIMFFTSEEEVSTPEVEPDDSEKRATENITEMIEDLTPSLILLIFVMAFMLMLLTIVDRM